jgi:hypothetical protein
LVWTWKHSCVLVSVACVHLPIVHPWSELRERYWRNLSIRMK